MRCCFWKVSSLTTQSKTSRYTALKRDLIPGLDKLHVLALYDYKLMTDFFTLIVALTTCGRKGSDNPGMVTILGSSSFEQGGCSVSLKPATFYTRHEPITFDLILICICSSPFYCPPSRQSICSSLSPIATHPLISVGAQLLSYISCPSAPEVPNPLPLTLSRGQRPAYMVYQHP